MGRKADLGSASVMHHFPEEKKRPTAEAENEEGIGDKEPVGNAGWLPFAAFAVSYRELVHLTVGITIKEINHELMEVFYQ